MLEGAARPQESERSDPAIIRHLMPLILVGFLVVLIALLVMQWPPLPGTDAVSVPLVLRMIGEAPGDGASALVRHFLDFGLYVLALIGIGLMLLAWRRGTRRPLVGLMAVALLGIAYVSGMALYNGPMVSVCGFTLIFFGGMVAWVASSLGGADETGTPDRTSTVSGPEEAVEIRTNEHASTHFVA